MEWRKSSYSNGGGGQCVEVTTTLDRVRDSKDPNGPTLNVGRSGVASLVRAVKDGRLDG